MDHCLFTLRRKDWQRKRLLHCHVLVFCMVSPRMNPKIWKVLNNNFKMKDNPFQMTQIHVRKLVRSLITHQKWPLDYKCKRDHGVLPYIVQPLGQANVDLQYGPPLSALYHCLWTCYSGFRQMHEVSKWNTAVLCCDTPGTGHGATAGWLSVSSVPKSTPKTVSAICDIAISCCCSNCRTGW